MEIIVLNILLSLIGLSVLAIVYCLYQLIRNKLVYKIRIKWINKCDDRYYLYSYDKMFDPSKSNYFGLNIPRDYLYKKHN